MRQECTPTGRYRFEDQHRDHTRTETVVTVRRLHNTLKLDHQYVSYHNIIFSCVLNT